jgi:hypothetical protein
VRRVGRVDGDMSNLSLPFSTKAGCQVATLAIVATVALGSAAFAGPIDAALVESSNSPDVEFMEYLQIGQIIRLGPNETIVLTYMNSCMRERITGGMVIIGMNRSDVRSGEVARLRVQCDAGNAQLTKGLTPIGARTIRGLN